MNREIKFRAKRKGKDEFVYGMLMKNLVGYTDDDGKTWKTKEKFVIQNCEDEWSQVFEIDEDTIGQFTGVKDKNGTEIYEGDIVSVCGIRKVVSYSKHGNLMFGGYSMSDSEIEYGLRIGDIEVVGRFF